MADKQGDRFTDKTGKQYELNKDPNGGHLRPYTLKNGKSGCAGVLIVVFVASYLVWHLFV
jgi:hypothetical protein